MPLTPAETRRFEMNLAAAFEVAALALASLPPPGSAATDRFKIAG